MNQCQMCGQYTEALQPVVIDTDDPDDYELVDICYDCYEREQDLGTKMHFPSDDENAFLRQFNG